MYDLLFSGQYLSLSMALTMGKTPPGPLLSYPFLSLACSTGDLDLAEAAVMSSGESGLLAVDWSGSTAAHIAGLCGHISVLEMLEREGAGAAGVVNRYGACPRDYLELRDPPGRGAGTVRVWRGEQGGGLVEVGEAEVARTMTRSSSFTCSGRSSATRDYLELLMLPTLSLHSVKVPEVVSLRSPPPGCSSIDPASTCLAFVGEEVGWGVFAAKHIAAGECFARYGGVLDVDSKARRASAYIVKGAFPGTLLDGAEHRSIGATINHSGAPNAKLVGFFERGIDVTVAVALVPIEAGQQIVVDYGKDMVGFAVHQGQENITIPLTTEDEVE